MESSSTARSAAALPPPPPLAAAVVVTPTSSACCSYPLVVAPSLIPGSGDGLFLQRHPNRNSGGGVIPKGTLLGWYGGTLLTPSEWVRRFAGGAAATASSSSHHHHEQPNSNPADYTFNTPLGPLSWMCPTSTTPTIKGDESVAVKLVHPPAVCCESGNVVVETQLALDYLHQRQELLNTTTISLSTVVGHQMNDNTGLVVAAMDHDGDDSLVMSRVKSHVVSAGWSTSGTSTQHQHPLGRSSRSGTNTTTDEMVTNHHSNNVVVLKDMVFEVQEGGGDEACKRLLITHVCPFVAKVDIVTVPVSSASNSGGGGGERKRGVELTTSYGPSFWVSRILHTLFYSNSRWNLARNIRKFMVSAAGVCEDDDLAPLPCPVAVVNVQPAINVGVDNHAGNTEASTTSSTSATISATATAGKKVLMIQTSDDDEGAGGGGFRVVDESLDLGRLRSVLAGLMSQDPAVFKLPHKAVTGILLRLGMSMQAATMASQQNDRQLTIIQCGDSDVVKCSTVATFFWEA